MKKINVIIDTDPGVDDSTALTIAMFSEIFDIKLITSTSGNVGIEKTTRNALHLVEKFNKDIPVCKGVEKPMKRELQNAQEIHGVGGMGNYIPPIVNKKLCDKNAIDKMVEVINKYKNNITLIELGPHTNLGYLFSTHKEVENYIERIVFEGGSPYGKPGVKPHISFNISCDPDAADIVMKTKIKKDIIPSELGRYIAHFDKNQVEQIRKINKTGEFLATMYDGYMDEEVGLTTQTNDLCAIMYMIHPEIFKTHKVDIEVDTKKMLGKTTITDNPNGLVTFVDEVDNEIFFKKFIDILKTINY